MDVEMLPQMQVDQQSSSSTNDKTQENLVTQNNRNGSSQTNSIKAQEENKAGAPDIVGTVPFSQPEEGELCDADKPMKLASDEDILSQLRRIDENEKQLIHLMLKDPSVGCSLNKLEFLSKIPQIISSNSCP